MELPIAAHNLAQLKIDKPSLFMGLTQLETESRAVVDAFINSGNTKNLKIDSDTMITLATSEISLKGFLQKFLMYYILSAQLDHEVYKKVAQVDNDAIGVDIMATVREEAEKHKMTKKTTKKVIGPPDVLYTVQSTTVKQTPSFTCYQCGKSGHLKKDCTTNTYCKWCQLKGHTTLNCNKRKKASVPYCEHCHRMNHDTKACKSKKTCTYCKKKVKKAILGKGHRHTQLGAIYTRHRNQKDKNKYGT